MRLVRRRLCSGLVLSLLAAPGAAFAQAPAAEFYAGRTITMLIGFGSGGGNDIWARMVARNIGRHIPGTPNVVPQNAPGAGGLLVANQLYAVSPKDGTVIALINRGIPMEPLLGGAGAHFDPLKFNWLGSPDRDTAICVSRKDSGVTSIQDLFQKELVMGATGSGADSAVYPEFMALLLGMKFKVVKGYKGSNEVRLAIERGEVQGICGSNDSVMTSDIGRSGKLNILFQARMEPDPRMKEVPLGSAGARNAEERQILELFFMRAALGRPFVAPPGVPPARIEILRRAFDKTMNDKAFIDEAAKQSFSVEPMTGEELAANVERAYKMPADVIKKTTEVLGRIAGAEKK
ncbi:MAG: tripartite tricarboxylate transporter substrate-binding protein [Hyphomicrobium sp.]